MPKILSLKTLRDVADLLGACADTDLNRLQELTTGAGRYKRYYSFSINKRNGQKRVIRAPIYELKRIQKCLSNHLYEIYKPHSCVKGYVKSVGIKSNAASHVKKKRILRVDLKDFFPSIHFGRIKGLFSKKPFNFPEDVAELLAEICIYRIGKGITELPQGAPTSPVVSNMICRALDGELVELAKENRCYYSRYADDITFSTKRSSFFHGICSAHSGKVEIGDALRTVIERNGFTINEEKTSLRTPSRRQMVTGLVVNEKVNVPREFIRNTRAMLWRWKTQGLAEAQQRFVSVDQRNRPLGKGFTPVKLVIRGRVEHICAVRGWGDPTCLKLSKRLSEIDDSFEFDKKRARACKMAVFVEGKTDYVHLRTALNYFKDNGKYTNLSLDFQEEMSVRNNITNDDQLFKHCEKESKQVRESHQTPIVCIFDRDDKKIINKVTDPEDRLQFKEWGNRVFSFAIPIPEHRSGNDLTCIELYYKDKDLFQKDKNDRRIFLGEEFNESTGLHKNSGKYLWRDKKTSLIVDSKVYETSGKQEDNVAMPKADFAEYISKGEAPFDDVDFEAFSAIFDEILKIGDELNSTQKD